MPYISDASTSMELASIASWALGSVYAGSDSEIYAAVLADRLLEANDADAGAAIARHLALGLGLLFLGCGGTSEAMASVLGAISSPLGAVAGTLLQACAYADTGNVLTVQALLRVVVSTEPGPAQPRTGAGTCQRRMRQQL